MYLTPADREQWEIVDKIGVLDVLAEQRARIVELEGLVRFREFERDQAWRVLESAKSVESGVLQERPGNA